MFGNLLIMGSLLSFLHLGGSQPAQSSTSTTTAPTTSSSAPALPASPTYAALGDSIAAGAGLTPYLPSTEDASCLRSLQGYPNYLAGKLNTHALDLACSGAATNDGLINAQTVGTSTIPAQLDRAFENGTPNLMTITIGANDVRWTDFIGKCYVGTCGTTADTLAEAGYLTYLQGKLGYVLHEIKDRSNGTPPKVLITGYYNPVTSTSCLGGQVTSKELAWINSETDNLNKAIRQTVSATTKVSSLFKGTYNFATFVPVSFAGHGLCSSTPWVQGLSDGAPLHPTVAGQQQIANTLYSYAK